jgi:hypothetical protein
MYQVGWMCIAHMLGKCQVLGHLFFNNYLGIFNIGSGGLVFLAHL